MPYIALLIAFLFIQIVGMDAALIVLSWLVMALIGIGLIGEFIIQPWRAEKSGSPCVRNSISVATESGRAGQP